MIGEFLAQVLFRTFQLIQEDQKRKAADAVARAANAEREAGRKAVDELARKKFPL